MKAYKRIVLIALLVITVGLFMVGCAPKTSYGTNTTSEKGYEAVLISKIGGTYVYRLVDTKADATCWITMYYLDTVPAIDCIPNSELSTSIGY